jgi:superoxide dismutase, Fe-Mn family
MYEAKNFEHLLGTKGMSDQLLKNHFTLYEGYVKNTNAVIAALKAGEVGSAERAELQRRFGWEWNGMRLHELYFGNMKSGGVAPTSGGEMEKIMQYLWQGFEGWKKEFVGIGTMRGIGWVVLTLDVEKKMVYNTWVNEHNEGHLAGTVPLLVMDVFEHAFMLDYGLKRADYITAFMDAIDWSVVEARLAVAMSTASAE